MSVRPFLLSLAALACREGGRFLAGRTAVSSLQGFQLWSVWFLLSHCYASELGHLALMKISTTIVNKSLRSQSQFKPLGSKTPLLCNSCLSFLFPQTFFYLQNSRIQSQFYWFLILILLQTIGKWAKLNFLSLSFLTGKKKQPGLISSVNPMPRWHREAACFSLQHSCPLIQTDLWQRDGEFSVQSSPLSAELLGSGKLTSTSHYLNLPGKVEQKSCCQTGI